jgi:very-short-patch-repair endonuclease
MREQGIQVLRFWNSEVEQDMQRVLALISNAICAQLGQNQ